MKIKSLSIKCFRGYKEKVTIEISDLCVIVGKNDIGKSTILEALDIFFNEGKGCVKIDGDDINKQVSNENNNCIEISVEFKDLPTSIVIDHTNETTLKEEYLTTENDTLHVIKRYSKTGKEKVFILAMHPQNPICNDLLLKKRNDLIEILDTHGIECPDRKRNSEIRKSIWESQEDLDIRECEIEVLNIDSKNIWEQIKLHMPLYTLFQSDRKNNDGDSEIQDPMRLAIREILQDET